MNLYEEIEKIKTQGYTEADAQSKLGQDIILKAISDSGMAERTTIKGCVVMRSISGNARRATQDFDLDFMQYSISDESIRSFVDMLNCIDDLVISFDGNIIELNHQDYNGKRIFLSISDTVGTTITIKMDLGVHRDLTVEQEEYAFDVSFQDGAISLFINSPAQMIAEKLKSMIRFGTRNTRYKDIFDICYLSERVNMKQLHDCIKKFILEDETLRNISTMSDIVKRIERMFKNTGYLEELEHSDKNWLEIPTEDVIQKDLDFFKSIKL